MESLIFFDKSRQYAKDTFPHTIWWKCYQSGVAPVVVSAPPARFLLCSCLSWCHLSVAVWVFSTVQKHPQALDLQTNFKSFNFLVSYHDVFFSFLLLFILLEAIFFPPRRSLFFKYCNFFANIIYFTLKIKPKYRC